MADNNNVLHFPERPEEPSAWATSRLGAVVVCQLVQLALSRAKQVLQRDMEQARDSGATPLLLSTIDHLDAAHQELLRALRIVR